MFMKKIVLGLALCLGLSQVAVAEEVETKGLQEDTNAAMAWIKAHPTAVKAIAASIATILAAGVVYTGVEIYRHDGKDGKMAKVRGGIKDAAGTFARPFVATGKGLASAGRSAGSKIVAGKDAVLTNMKNHYIVWGCSSAAVVSLIAAAVIAEFATDEDSQLKLSNLWKKFFSKHPDVVVAE